MRYLCLVYIDPTLADAASAEDWREIDRQSLAENEALKASGHYITSNALADPRTARTLRSRGGNITVADGPFAETKEHLGGFFLIEAKDMDEAVALASQSAIAQMGSIEVRATAGF